MTDERIIKALEHNASKCKFYEDEHDGGLFESTLDLINRQKAEIERLEEESADKERAYTVEYCLRKELKTKLKTAKSEVIKRLAEKIKQRERIMKYDLFPEYAVSVKDIDDIVKEIEGENNV